MSFRLHRRKNTRLTYKLTSHWKLKEGNGLIVFDSSGNNNHATIIGGAIWIFEEKGYVLKFDGIDDIINSNTLVDIGTTNNVTITLWFNAGIKGSFDYLIAVEPAGNQGILMSGATNNPITYIWEDTSDEWNAANGLTFNLNTWYFVALIIEPTIATIYLSNGNSLVKWTNIKTHNAKNLANKWQIADDPNNSGREFTGKIDDIRIYNRSLTNNEINELFFLTK